MSINDNKPQHPGQGQGQAYQGHNEDIPPFARTIVSLHEGGMLGSPIGRGLGSEVYAKFKERLAEIFKQTTDPNAEIALIDLDNVNEPALVFSAIIIAMRYKDRPELGISFYPIILEDTGEKLLPYTDSQYGQPIEVTRVTSDAFDEVMREKAINKVIAYFGTPDVHGNDGCVLPSDVNLEDGRLVYGVALNAAWACGTDLEVRSKGFFDLNLANIRHESTLNVTIGFAKKQVADVVNQPMRSDVMIQFDSRKNVNVKTQNVNSGDREAKISEISGFIDLVRVLSPQNQFSMYMQQPAYGQMPQAMQPYAARLIVTNLVSSKLYTMASVLLALTTAVGVRDNNNWIQTFRPIATGTKEIDLNDIGALNIDANIIQPDPSGFGPRIDTKSDNFKLEELGRLAGALVRPGLMISLDCPESGPQSWYMSVFSQAANGNAKAYNAIYEGAMTLTNGAFGKYFPKGTPMFTDNDNRIHNGYYIDKMEKRRDIRDIDHLAICNIVGERNPQYIREWANTFLLENIPLAIRLATRKNIIQAMTHETAVFTGFSKRVTLTSAFFDALISGVVDTGLSVKINTPLSAADINAAQGVANFANVALSQPGQTFMTQSGYGWPGQQQFGQHGSLRW